MILIYNARAERVLFRLSATHQNRKAATQRDYSLFFMYGAEGEIQFKYVTS